MAGNKPESAIEGASRTASLDASRLLTECLTLQQAAAYFGVGRRSIREVLEKIPGAERSGRGFWRVPLEKMPPRYLMDRDLVKPAIISPAAAPKIDQK